ncbi:MAG: L-ribulose-5-phosphate 4-epimerase [Clostridiales bacterium]|nr:L-ribulose-5-phosphate 4-epimerase [Clostridiales bacterium]
MEELKERVFRSNLLLVEYGLVLFTWGNVSAPDTSGEFVVIKPSGISYDKMKPSDMVVVTLDGRVVEGSLSPSTDTPTHLALYKAFGMGGIVHTHSKWATIWAQAGKDIPALGTTHADHFRGAIPVTRSLTAEEIKGDYERETGDVIAETFRERGIDPNEVPAALVNNHGPFAWGDSPEKAVENAAVLEYIAEMAHHSFAMNPDAKIDRTLLDKHYLRKHGKDSYYGQK